MTHTQHVSRPRGLAPQIPAAANCSEFADRAGRPGVEGAINSALFVFCSMNEVFAEKADKEGGNGEE